MDIIQPSFSLLISTKNRLTDLTFTLEKIKCLFQNDSVECVVFDDGSTDGTYEYVKENFPKTQLQRNAVSKGYIYCRNKMLNETHAIYAISLDDDAHFVTENPLESIQTFFETNPQCGLLALRIFWGFQEPHTVISTENSTQVQGFVGCAHVWRMSAWRVIPNYPEWFIFYGEENFASYQLFKTKWQVQYFPTILVNHRVDIKSRESNTDYVIRLRRSLASSWYLLFLFFPIASIPRKMGYSIWMQLQKVGKGDFKVLQAIISALLDLFFAIPKIVKNSNRFSQKEYVDYNRLPETKIYWKIEN